MQAAGGVDNHVIHFAGLGGLQRVEDHRARIGAGRLLDHVGGSARAPYLQLLDGGGAEGVGRAQQHAAAFGLIPAGQLPDGGGFARAVHAHDKHHGRRLGHVGNRPLGRFQHFEKMLRDELLDFARVGQLLAVRALADALQNFADRVHADVGGDERILQLVEQVGVDFLAAGDSVFQAIHQARTRLLDAGLQALEQVGFLFYGAK